MPYCTIEEYTRRFWSKVDDSDAFGCWEWQAAKIPKGYGSMLYE